jgi:hypothetical protein
MKFLLGLLFGLIVAIGIAFAAVKVAFGSLDAVFDNHVGADDEGGGSEISRSYDDLKDFDKIDAAGVYDLDVTVGPAFSIALKGSEREMNRVEVKVENGTLVLERNDEGRDIHIGKHMGVKATVTLPALKGFEASGVVDGDIKGVNADSFKVDLSGVGDVNLQGTCGALDVDVSGVGDLDAEKLECKSVVVDVSGVGSASVFASDSADATISGMGEISIYGKPAKVEKNDSMFSKITVK